MKTYSQLILALMLLVTLGCSKDPDDLSAVRSQFLLQFEDRTISATEGDPTLFAFSALSIGQVAGLVDSSRVLLRTSLGSKVTHDEPMFNTLIVTSNQYMSSGMIIDTEFRSWLPRGAQPFVRNGLEEEGVGIIWFDEQGTMWVSGKHIGEDWLFGESAVAETVFPAPGDFQQDARFSLVTSDRIEPQPGFDYSQRVVMEFNGTLYNELGDRLIIQQGTFETVMNGIRR